MTSGRVLDGKGRTIHRGEINITEYKAGRRKRWLGAFEPTEMVFPTITGQTLTIELDDGRAGKAQVTYGSSTIVRFKGTGGLD